MGELNIVPFLDIIVNVVMYLLIVIAFVLTTTQVNVRVPSVSPNPRVGATSEPLGLTVVVGSTGIFVAGANGSLAPGCARVVSSTRAPAVARHDWASLTRCARAVRDAHPSEESVVLSADPEIPYEDVVAAMDALRPAFPDVQIAAGVR